MVKSFNLTECVFWNATAPVGPRPCRFEVSTPHKIRHKQSVGLLWTSDQLVAAVVTYTTYNNLKRRTSMPSVGIEPTIPASERQQTHALDFATTGMGPDPYSYHNYLRVKTPYFDIHISTSVLSPLGSWWTFVFRVFLCLLSLLEFKSEESYQQCELLCELLKCSYFVRYIHGLGVFNYNLNWKCRRKLFPHQF